MSKQRRWVFLTLFPAVLIVGFLVWNWTAWRADARIAAGYSAHVACSCRYVQGRMIGSCKEDVDPVAGMISLTDLPEEKAVRASAPLMAARTARFRAGWGCLLDPA